MIRVLAVGLCVGLALAFPMVLSGCAGGGGGGGGGGLPPDGDGDTAAGRVTYEASCADCHGTPRDGGAMDLAGLPAADIEAGATAETHPDLPDAVLTDEDYTNLEAFLAEEGDEEPDSLIIAGSRTHTYVIVDPDTGEDIVEVSPDTHSADEFILGYQCDRVYFLGAPGPSTGRADIFGCDMMTGENVVNLTADLEDFSASAPEGSPAEAKLVFSDTYDNHIYVINEDGTGMTQATFDEETHTLLNGTAVESGGQFMPTWSPDGTKIAYQARVGEVSNMGLQHEVVIVMDADGSNKELIYDRQGSAHFREIAWSYDGNFIMANHAREGGGRQLLAISVATTTVSDLTDVLLADTAADFGNMWMSPTDFTIVFNYYLPGGGSLYTAQLQASGDTVSVVVDTTRLTEDAIGHGYALPDWAPYEGTGGDGAEPECTTDEDCAAGQVCVGGVCVAGGDEEPDSLIIAGSRTHTYVIVDPDTGKDIVEVSPETHSAGEFVLGYQCDRVYFLGAPGSGTGRADVFGCDMMTGENVVNLTADLEDFSASAPEGSPAEAKLVFSDTYDSHIYVINEDGTGMTQATFDEETHTLLDGTAVESGGQFMPTWSPDGTKIAYQARVGEVSNMGIQHEVVIVMDADGSNKELIYDRQGSAHFREIAWSYDGNFIMANNCREGGGRQLLAISVATTTVSDLTDVLLADTAADFGNMWMSPTDFTIVFNYYLPGGGSLYTAQLQASGDTVSVVVDTTQLTEDAIGHGYALPDWAPYVP